MWHAECPGSGERHSCRVRSGSQKLLVLTLILLGSCEALPVRSVYRVPSLPRFSAARLAGGMAWARCTTSLPEPQNIGALMCAQPQSGATAVTPAVHASLLPPSQMHEGGADDGKRFRALSDLAWSATDARALARSVAQLKLLVAAKPTDAGLLNDLAVSHLLASERTASLLSALEALDVIERAVALASLDPSLVWNQALIQEHLGLHGAALVSWERVEHLEPDHRWRAELLQRKRRAQVVLERGRLAAITDSMLSVDGAASPEQVSRAATLAPQWGRDRAWLLLARWSECMLNGDERCAVRNRALLQPIVEVETLRGGDSSAATALHSIDSAGRAGPAVWRGLARGYADFGVAMLHYRRSSFDEAIPLLRRASSRFRTAKSSDELWALYYLAASQASVGEYAAARRQFSDLLQRSRHTVPLLAGKSQLALGVIEGRRGNTEAAVHWYRRAMENLDRARDSESLGFAVFLMSETYAAQGRWQDSHAAAWQSIRLNAAFHGSATWRSQLAQLATLARSDGLPHAALSIGHESVAIARGIGEPTSLALAHRDVARNARALGLDSLANRALDSADLWSRQIPAGRGGDRVRAYVDLGRGEVLRAHSTEQSLSPLLRATAVLRGFRDDIFLPVALHEAALSTGMLGDTATTAKLLTEAISVLESQYETFQSSSLRASFAETAEAVFDSRIALSLGQGDAASAFAYLERSRRAAYRSRTTKPPNRTASGRDTDALALTRQALAPGTTLLAYAVLRDRVVIWQISRDTSRLLQVQIRRDSLAALIRQAQRFVVHEDFAPALAASAALHALLLRPALHTLPVGQDLIIVPDRELFQLSFAWLRDGVSRQFAIERHPLRYAPSADFARSTVRRGVPVPARARLLALGNDARFSTVDDSLPALAHAELEARHIAGLYPRHDLLIGAQVSRPSVRRMARQAEILHFAGHAVFDEARPERSYLLIGELGGGAKLLAGEIAELRTSKLRLVVLSACRTLNARASRVGPASGLAYSFLQAGASGTVTSLWDVEDGGAAAFMASFHAYLVAGQAPAMALRAAQLDFLRSTDGSMRSPRVWAAFILTGS